jgi:hypothetical protein
MPRRHIGATDLTYYLVLFDSNGAERAEQDGSLLSATLTEAVQGDVTDVFISSHGWKGDIPAAIDQYDRWIATMAAQQDDRGLARALDTDFKPVIVGVHWPSLPWGNEAVRSALLADNEPDEFAAEAQLDAGELVRRYAERIADTDAARSALTVILTAADDDAVRAQLDQGSLPAHLDAAYQTLFDEAGLGLGGAAAAPGSDQQLFRPALTIAEWTRAESPSAGHQPSGRPGLLAGGSRTSMRHTLLMPVRQVSFWAMKHRARHVGETGVHKLLVGLQESAPHARFHLMGHSFGCIVVSAAVAGPLGGGGITSRLPRPVQSLFLVQGAMSLWSFADSIPYPPQVPGYFHPVKLDPALISGPVVTTRSRFDRAVGTFFPLGAKVGHDRLLGTPPEYGGVGAFGIKGTNSGITHDLPVRDATAGYQFARGHIYNIEASEVIRHGGGPSGAHSDIAHPQIAHLFWQAALAGMGRA